MSEVLRRGRARFARLPAAAKAAAVLTVVALYTIALLAVIGGGGDGGRSSMSGDERAARSSPQARQIRTVFAGLEPETPEREDRAELRRMVLNDARCTAGRCRVVYSVGVPGVGLILEQQADVLKRILEVTGADEVRFDVRREKTLRDPGDPNPAEEETVTGAPLFTLRCDRDRAKALDPRTTDAEELMERLCELRTVDMGAQHSRSPDRRSAGAGGTGVAEEIPGP